MSTLELIVFYTLLGSVVSLIGGLALLAREKYVKQFSHFLASFAAGTLLSAAFFDLLPEAVHEAEESGGNIFVLTLFGILLFFLIERFIHWFHHHSDGADTQNESRSTLLLIITSDAIHNFIDGVVIAATFLISIPLGIVTTMAVAAHEIPQEMGDFGLMLHKGMRKRNIIIVNVLSALISLVGALLTYWIGSSLQSFIPGFLAITAGFFIYIAASDIIPEIHLEKRMRHALIEVIMLFLGVFVVWGVIVALQGIHS